MSMLDMPVSEWDENIVLVDADWLDNFVFDVTVNFERMLERAIPKAALDKWVDYLSLDGGLRPGENKTQVLFLHSAQKNGFANCIPSSFQQDLDGKAFHDNLGEFSFYSFPVEEDMVSLGSLFVQSMEVLLSSEKVKRLMLVPDMDKYGVKVQERLRGADLRKTDVTLFSAEPLSGLRCPQEILTYSMLATLGVEGSELKF